MFNTRVCPSEPASGGSPSDSSTPRSRLARGHVHSLALIRTPSADAHLVLPRSNKDSDGQQSCLVRRTARHTRTTLVIAHRPRASSTSSTFVQRITSTRRSLPSPFIDHPACRHPQHYQRASTQRYEKRKRPCAPRQWLNPDRSNRNSRGRFDWTLRRTCEMTLAKPSNAPWSSHALVTQRSVLMNLILSSPPVHLPSLIIDPDTDIPTSNEHVLFHPHFQPQRQR
jgi:hypothetical protein